MGKRCKHKNCLNDAAKGRRECDKCRKRRYVERNPLAASYDILRSSAKRRGKAFDLTIEQWKQFCEETGYLEKKGPFKNDLSVDRIDDTKGYVHGNLQVLTVGENSVKGHKERRWPGGERELGDPF